MPADGTSLPVTTNGDNGTSRFHGSSWTGEPSDINLYQDRGAPERLLAQTSNPCAGPIDRTLPCDRSADRIGYGIFIIEICYDPEALRC
jgi:hypothetical protein